MPPHLPPPTPLSDDVQRRMSRQPRRDTAPEMAIRRSLHGRGARFFVDRRVIVGLRRRADIVFPRWRLAVFVDGCFWHGCPQHGNRPRHNSAWWEAKLDRNRRRDEDTDRILASHGWTVLRIWEHEDPADAVQRVLDCLVTRGWAGPRRG